MTDEIRYRLLAYLDEHPSASQREVARHLGVSVGRLNYCLRALIERGWVKMRNFRNSKNKLAYMYVLTPRGVEEKMDVTYRFLEQKMAEYDATYAEIERLTNELAQSGVAPDVEQIGLHEKPGLIRDQS